MKPIPTALLRRPRRRLIGALLGGLSALALCASAAAAPASGVHAALAAQVVPTQVHAPQGVATWHGGRQVVVPQARAWSFDSAQIAVTVERVTAAVRLVEHAATTTLDVYLRNPSPRRAEAVLLLPVPRGAAVSGFDFEGAAAEPTAVLLPRDEARRTYDDIVRRVKDPALLEFCGYDLVRSSVFPVEPGGTQRVRLVYEHLLERTGERVDYALPRSESLAVEVPWDVRVELRSKRPIAMVYSPSHDLATELDGPNRRVVRVAEASRGNPGSFLLSYLLEEAGGVSASLLAYPDPEVGGGWFLLMAGPPVSHGATPAVKREVTLVLDRSGSMAGEKMDQARAAALQVIEGLALGEAFNVIDYSSRVESFAPAPVVKDAATTKAAREYLASITPLGGTNLHDALHEALRPAPREGMLPIVLFFTDGLPTVGRTSEVAIRQMVEKANVHGRRVFTFGVGHDVNVPLLDRLADTTRATASYVLPGEDVEVAVARTFQRLYGPVLADLELATLDGTGAVTTRAIRDVLPERLPDLFEGDHLVLFGQYRGSEPLDFRLTGTLRGVERTFAFRFALDAATTKNAFVPRLWATRKIAYLVDRIRQAGAADGTLPVAGASLLADPRYAELAEEILRLSTRFGVLSEYTAFLATEGTDLGDWDRLLFDCNANLDARAVRTRVGGAAVNQGRNFNAQKLAVNLDYKNRFWNDANERVEVAGVQQVCDRAFFLRGERWIDTTLVAADAALAPDRTVQLGSPEHAAVVDALVAQGRAGLVALPGEVLLRLDGANVLIVNR